MNKITGLKLKIESDGEKLEDYKIECYTVNDNITPPNLPLGIIYLSNSFLLDSVKDKNSLFTDYEGFIPAYLKFKNFQFTITEYNTMKNILLRKFEREISDSNRLLLEIG